MNEVKQERTAPFYEFGPFRVDTVKYVLTRDGEVAPLNLKAFEILLALIQHHGQVLEKNELLQRVWPDTVVEENNLARNISALRKALDEQPKEHQYILTVPGRGYRFVASVREVNGAREDFIALQANGSTASASAFHAVNGSAIAAEPAPCEASGESEALNGKIVPHKRWVIIALAALATLVTVVLAASLISRRSHDNSPAPQQRKLWQLTFDPGLESEPSWSPDGRMIAYSSDRSGNFDIWVRPVGEGNPVRVTTSEAHDWQPDWAPSGRALYFEGLSQGVINLWKVEVDPQSLRWIAGPERLTTGAGPDLDVAISPDGRKLAFTTRAEQTRVWSLPFDASSDRIKGEGRPLTAAGVKAVYPDLSPDGQRLAFVTRRPGKAELWEKSLKDGRETLFGADELSRGLPHWSYDGSRLVYNRSRQLNLEGSRFETSLVMAPAGGGAEQTLTTLRQEAM